MQVRFLSVVLSKRWYNKGMKQFRYIVMLQVEVEAYNADDAKEILEDTFSEGEEVGVTITDVVVKEAK